MHLRLIWKTLFKHIELVNILHHAEEHLLTHDKITGTHLCMALLFIGFNANNENKTKNEDYELCIIIIACSDDYFTAFPQP